MIDSIINTKDLDKADVVLVQAGYEKTTSSREGTKAGPKQILKMLDSKLELFDRTYQTQPSEKIKISQHDLGDLNSLASDEALKTITTKCEELIKKDKFVFLLGGEHTVSFALLRAISDKIDPKDVTVLQIDAHCDLRDDDGDYSESPTQFAHSCVMRRAHELGYSLVQVGIRTYYKDEYKYFTNPENKIKVFEWSGQEPSVAEILKSIQTKYVYLTIDVDGFDPSVMPGTGTPVPGGLSWYYGMELIEQVIKNHELVGADIVEVAPMPDSVLTEYSAAQLTYSIIAHKFRDKL